MRHRHYRVYWRTRSAFVRRDELATLLALQGITVPVLRRILANYEPGLHLGLLVGSFLRQRLKFRCVFPFDGRSALVQIPNLVVQNLWVIHQCLGHSLPGGTVEVIMPESMLTSPTSSR